MSPLPHPPKEISVYWEVDAKWRAISQKAMREHPVDLDISRVEVFIEKCDLDFRTGRYSADHDWLSDISAAKRLHETQKDWLKYNSLLLSAQKDFWKDRIRVLEDLSTKLVQEGFKYILALHGGTALACLNALGSAKIGGARTALLLGLFGGALGIGMLAVGKLTLIHLFAHQSAILNSRLTVPKGWSTYRAIGRWLNLPQRRRALRLADIMIYGSMLWFFLYAFSCFVILSTSP